MQRKKYFVSVELLYSHHPSDQRFAIVGLLDSWSFAYEEGRVELQTVPISKAVHVKNLRICRLQSAYLQASKQQILLWKGLNSTRRLEELLVVLLSSCFLHFSSQVQSSLFDIQG
jgi:hypothetical protein